MQIRRRRILGCIALSALAAPSLAGVVDWYNGVKVGATLPEFDAEYLGAAPPADSRLQLIDFWATWCAPCRDEFPHLNRLSRTHGPEPSGIGLTQESVKVASGFLRTVDVQYPVGAGGSSPLQRQLGVRALPYAILVNRARVIVWRGQASSLSVEQAAAWLRTAG